MSGTTIGRSGRVRGPFRASTTLDELPSLHAVFHRPVRRHSTIFQYESFRTTLPSRNS
jgi:hypothetical protein